MKITEQTLKQIITFEGMKLKAYKCPANVWTIGVGHTGGVKEGMTITPEQAIAFLRIDIVKFEKGVQALRLAETQGQFDALVSFAFNVGLKALQFSKLARLIRKKSSEKEIRAEFMRWINAGGKPLKGLITRRQWEANTFFS